MGCFSIDFNLDIPLKLNAVNFFILKAMFVAFYFVQLGPKCLSQRLGVSR